MSGKEERKEDRIFEKLRMAGGRFVGDGREDGGNTISLCSGKLREKDERLLSRHNNWFLRAVPGDFLE